MSEYISWYSLILTAIEMAKRKTSAFWIQLSARCRTTRMSEAALARKFELTPQTLASWKVRNQFRRLLLPRLRDILSWQITEEEATRLGCDLIGDPVVSPLHRRHPAENVLLSADRAYRKAEAGFLRYSETTIALLESIGKDCFFAFSAPTTAPFEFEQGEEGRTLAKAIAGAIARGALCLYIRPNEAGVRYFESGWGFGRVIQQEGAKREFDAFRLFIRDYLGRGQSSAEEVRKLTFERLAQCYITSSPMWMPGVGLGIVGWADPSDLKTRVTISLPGSKFGGVLAFPQQSALEFRFARVLSVVVTAACDELGRLAEDPKNFQARSYIEVEKDLKGDEQEWVALFYSRFKELLRPIASGQPDASILRGSYTSGAHA